MREKGWILILVAKFLTLMRTLKRGNPDVFRKQSFIFARAFLR